LSGLSARLAPHAAEPLSEVALVVQAKYLFTVVAIETWLIDQLNVLPFRFGNDELRFHTQAVPHV
jgi:hypothetical protein